MPSLLRRRTSWEFCECRLHLEIVPPFGGKRGVTSLAVIYVNERALGNAVEILGLAYRDYLSSVE